MIEANWTVRLGTLVEVEHESFVPLPVIAFHGAKLNREPVEASTDLPSYVFSLRKKFDELQAGAPPKPSSR